MSRRSRSKKSKKQLTLPLNPIATCSTCVFLTITRKGFYCFRRRILVSEKTPACHYYLEDKKFAEISTPHKDYDRKIAGGFNNIIVWEKKGEAETAIA